MKPKKVTHEQMNRQNWRYKKQTSPTDEFVHRNGPVKIIKTASEPVKKKRYANAAMQAAAAEYAYQMKLGRKFREII